MLSASYVSGYQTSLSLSLSLRIHHVRVYIYIYIYIYTYAHLYDTYNVMYFNTHMTMFICAWSAFCTAPSAVWYRQGLLQSSVYIWMKWCWVVAFSNTSFGSIYIYIYIYIYICTEHWAPSLHDSAVRMRLVWVVYACKHVCVYASMHICQACTHVGICLSRCAMCIMQSCVYIYIYI